MPDEKADRDVRVDEAIERFLTYLSEDKGREESTIEDYRGVHAKWGSPVIGRRKVRDVDDEHMDRIFGNMRTAGLSASRMATARNLYGPFFRWAKRRRIIRRSPMAEFEMPFSQHVAIERVPPEIDQLGCYLEAAVKVVPDIAPLLTLDAVTGLRAGELRGLRRSRILAKSLKLNIDAASGRKGIKPTKTRRTREVSVDAETMAMLLRHCQRMDERAAESGLSVANDAFVFSYEADCSKPMSRDYLTKRVAALKEHLGIGTKRPETIALEDEALRLFRMPAQPRPGARGPKPKGGLPFKEIGARLGRSGHWAEKAVASALRREQAPTVDPEEFFDGSIIALRKFTSSELLDAGFNIATVAQRQGHGPQVLARHYAKARRSSDRKAAEHLGQLVHGGQG
ncbi:MAG: tyrosine-type recombinase/integrase [Acidimicrobiales bacterium]